MYRQGQVQLLGLADSGNVNRLEQQHGNIGVKAAKLSRLVKGGDGKIIDAVFFKLVYNPHAVAVAVAFENSDKIFIVGIPFGYGLCVMGNAVKIYLRAGIIHCFSSEKVSLIRIIIDYARVNFKGFLGIKRTGLSFVVKFFKNNKICD